MDRQTGTPQWPGDPQAALYAYAAALGSKVSRNTLQAKCPVHQGHSNKTLSIKTGENRLYAKCWSECASMPKGDFNRLLEQKTGIRLSPGNGRAGHQAQTQTEHDERQPQPPSNETQTAARAIWLRASPIPTGSKHPARRWTAARKLWRPEFPLPSCLRWLPEPVKWAPEAAGVILALAALPHEWELSWPKPPPVRGIQRIPVMQDGEPAGEKKSLGTMTGCVMIIGDPVLERSQVPATVCEGAADALAIASRQEGTVISTLGTSSMYVADRNGIAAWLAKAPSGLDIWADRDTSAKGRAPAGLKAARSLAGLVKEAGASREPEVAYATEPYKDAAEAAKMTEFPPLNDSFGDYARTLKELHPQLPRWYIAILSDTATVTV